MDPAEDGIVEFFGQVRDGAAQQASQGSGVYSRVVIRGLDPIDFRDLHELDAPGSLDHERPRPWRCISCLCDPPLGSLESAAEARNIERLEEIVERSGFERASTDRETSSCFRPFPSPSALRS